jgi:hypothetical protein
LPTYGKLNQAFDFLKIESKTMIEPTTSIDPAPREVPTGDKTGNHKSPRAWARPAA